MFALAGAHHIHGRRRGRHFAGDKRVRAAPENGRIGGERFDAAGDVERVADHRPGHRCDADQNRLFGEGGGQVLVERHVEPLIEQADVRLFSEQTDRG
ncbi:MAG: hypothetical protein M5R36_14760 [Deltaproteobacteria bacterium]|nr:hypothetical protein [Deltaproteobacteria bacterium]